MMTPRVHTNLSAPGLKHLTITQLGLKAITVGSLTLTMTFWWIGTNLHQKIDSLEDQAQTIMTQTNQVVVQAKNTGNDLTVQAIQKIPQQISFVKQVRERVGFSWTQLLNDLESAVPGNLMMSAVSLDEKTNTVRLNGSTQSLKQLTRLIHQLENHQAFHDVILTQHVKKKNQKTTSQPFIVFSLTVSYDPNHQHSKTMKS